MQQMFPGSDVFLDALRRQVPDDRDPRDEGATGQEAVCPSATRCIPGVELRGACLEVSENFTHFHDH